MEILTPRKLNRKCRFSVDFICGSTRNDFKPFPGQRRQYFLVYTTCIVYWDARRPLLFDLLLEKVIEGIKTSERITLDNSKVNILANANDLAFTRRSQAETEQLCKELTVTAEKVGLWNTTKKKTEYIVMSRLEKEYQQEKFMNTSKDVCYKEWHISCTRMIQPETMTLNWKSL